jgi:hypothetical protein
MVDLSFDPIADAAALAALLLMLRDQSKGSKKILRRPKSSDVLFNSLEQKKASTVPFLGRNIQVPG